MKTDISLTKEWQEMCEFLGVARDLLNPSLENLPFDRSIGYSSGALCALARAICVTDPIIREIVAKPGPKETAKVLDAFFLDKLPALEEGNSLHTARKLLDLAISNGLAFGPADHRPCSRDEAVICFEATSSVVNIIAPLLNVDWKALPSTS